MSVLLSHQPAGLQFRMHGFPLNEAMLGAGFRAGRPAVPAFAALLLTVACWQPAVAHKPSQALPGTSFQNQDSSSDMLLRTLAVDEKASQKAAASAAPTPAIRDEWWAAEGSEEDEMNCDATHARPGQIVGLKAHSNVRACARSCRYNH